MHRRHRIFWVILRPLVIAFSWLKFGYRFKTARDLPDKYIVLSNHTTDWDPLFVGCSFPRQMYFVASEHIARWKFAYKLIDFLLGPILRYKGTVAASTVMDIFRRLRAGNNVAFFAEGARCWDGVTGPILPSTGKTVKSAKCALVTYKLTGGYFVSPRWSETLRRGDLHGEVVRVYTQEELAAMTVDEINEAINRDLYEDAYAQQEKDPKPYRGKNLAHGMENLFFICPLCGAYDTLFGDGDRVCCSSCGGRFTYNEYGYLQGIRQKTVRELLDWQKQLVEQDAQNGKAYSIGTGALTRVVGHVEETVAQGPILLDGEKLVCGEFSVFLSEIQDLSSHGRRAIVFSSAHGYYELIPDPGVCAQKLPLLFRAYKNQKG